MPEEKVDAAALGISVQVGLDEARQVVFQTHIAQEASKEQINELLDKLADVSDRQAARIRLPRLRKDLEAQEIILKQILEDLVRVDEQVQSNWDRNSRKGPVKLSASEEQHKKNAAVTVERTKQGIERLKATIAADEALLAGK